MIRLAGEEDFVRIAELEALLFEDSSLSPAALEREARASRLFVIGEPAYAYAIVGQGDGVLDLLRIGVNPEQQGKGAGARLLEHVLGLGGPVVLTVRKNNHRALRLYKKYGFEIIGHFQTVSAWVMRRDASAACPSG